MVPVPTGRGGLGQSRAVHKLECWIAPVESLVRNFVPTTKPYPMRRRMCFGAPTTPLGGWILPGRYKFGAMQLNGEFLIDKLDSRTICPFWWQRELLREGSIRGGKNTFGASAGGGMTSRYLNPVVIQNSTNYGTVGDFSANYQRQLIFMTTCL